MPALRLYGRAFHIGSDDIPLLALGGAIFHAAWIVAIAITAQDIVHIPDICHHEGWGYMATVALLLIFFTLGFIIELMLIYEGCQGGPFEVSKRRKIPFLLTLRIAVAACEILASAYGTYVLAATDLMCKRKEVVIWNPKREVLVLVILTWTFQILILLNALIWYNAWPEHPVMERWEHRFDWLGRWLCCNIGKRPAEEHEKRRRTLRRISRWVSGLVGHADLTPSDAALALILVATLQRRTRRDHIAAVLAAAREGDEEEGVPVPSPAVSLLERAHTIAALPTALPSGFGLPEPRAARVDSKRTEEVLIDIGEEAGVSPAQVAATLTAAATESMVDAAVEGVSSGFLAQPAGTAEQQDTEAEEKQQPAGTGAAASLSPEASAPLGQGSPLDKFVRQVALLRDACLTPSGLDEELRRAAAGMPQRRAVQLYTGNHWHVEAAILAEVQHFTTFASGVYGYSESRSLWWRTMAAALMPGREPTEREARSLEALNRAEVGSLAERLYYETVIAELGDSAEVLYVSVANAALAHLPYLIALDHHTRSVVLALRGTTSIEDVITDSVAVPERLADDFVPKALREAQSGASAGPLYAHAGIRAAADAVLRDLEENRILPALIQGDYGDCERSAAEEVASKDGGESATTQAGHYVAALMQRKLDCRGWRLVVTGHSLGAGAAALIALHLYGRFGGIHCWALSPPGGLMSTNLARLVEPFCTSVVLGKDVVPRSSVANLGRLIDQMVSALALCKLSKTEVLLRWLGKARRHEHEERLFWRLDEAPAEALQALQAYNAGIEARSRMLELVPPGRVIFLRPLKAGGARAGFDAVWVRPEEIIREGMLVSPKMVEDHACGALQAALLAARAHAGGSAQSIVPEYFPPVVPGTDDASSSEQAPPGQQAGGVASALENVL